MSGSTIGKLFQVTTWGESHGDGIGVVIDGCPAGLTINKDKIQSFLNRRKPGQSAYTTSRQENDLVKILSGVFEEKTTGAPISMMIANESQRSSDYSDIATYYRPGHADYTFDSKYGFRDYRGGGRSSGRETIGRVAAGAIASMILETLGIEVLAYTRSIGNVSINYALCDKKNIPMSPVYMPDLTASANAEQLIRDSMEQQDSIGGIIECIVSGVPAGIGDPVFDKLDANLAKAIMSIGAVKGIEIGDGFAVAGKKGSENNDVFRSVNGSVQKVTNHSGGILGGISDGSEIILRAAIKPTPSISRLQQTVNQSKENIDISIHGRHDPVIVPRAVVVVEAMTAITILDLMMCNVTSTMDGLHRFYRKS